MARFPVHFKTVRRLLAANEAQCNPSLPKKQDGIQPELMPKPAIFPGGKFFRQWVLEFAWADD
jgi:hypothetical protein